MPCSCDSSMVAEILYRKRENKNTMKMIKLFIFLLFISNILFGQNNSIPHLQKKDSATQLIVNNKPFLILGGELHNSSTSGADYMRSVWEQLKKKNLNTVVAPVYWE